MTDREPLVMKVYESGQGWCIDVYVGESNVASGYASKLKGILDQAEDCLARYAEAKPE